MYAVVLSPRAAGEPHLNDHLSYAEWLSVVFWLPEVVVSGFALRSMWFVRGFPFLRAHVLVCRRHVAQGNECLLNTTQFLHAPGRSDYC